MVEQKPVNVGLQVVLCIIPYLWIYGFYRIKKLRMGIGIIIITLVIDMGTQSLFPYPYGLGLAVIVAIVFPIAFIVHLSNEWNTRVSSGERVSKSKTSLEILKESYAKGKITKEEFDKIKDDLSL